MSIKITNYVRSAAKSLLSVAFLSAAFVFATTLLFIPIEARADAGYDQCTKRGQTSFDFNSCGQQWVKREEAALTVSWRNLYTSLKDPQAKSLLLQEQRNWIKYKDSSCRFFGIDAEYGSMGWSTFMAPCIARVIRVRIKQLDEYADPYE